MAGLLRYNKQVTPSVAPKVNFYKGEDLYNIGDSLSKFRSARNNLAIEDALARMERYSSEELIARSENEDAYFGDQTKVKAAFLQDMQDRSAKGDAYAQQQLELYYNTGELDAPVDRHFSTYQDRWKEQAAMVADEVGLKGDDRKAFETQVYRMETQFEQSNELQKDLIMDNRAKDGANAIINMRMDIGDWDGAVRTVKSAVSDGLLTETDSYPIIQGIREKQDYTLFRDMVINGAYYADDMTPEEAVLHVSGLLEKGEYGSNDGVGITTKEGRDAALATIKEELTAINNERIHDVQVKTSEHWEDALTDINLFKTGERTDLDLFKAREKYVNLIATNDRHQEPDRYNEQELQRIVEMYDRALVKEEVAEDKDKIEAYATFQLQSLNNDLVRTADPAERRNILANHEMTIGGKKYLGAEFPGILNTFFRDTTDISNNFKTSAFKAIEGSTLSSTAKREAIDDISEWVMREGNDVTEEQFARRLGELNVYLGTELLDADDIDVGQYYNVSLKNGLFNVPEGRRTEMNKTLFNASLSPIMLNESENARLADIAAPYLRVLDKDEKTGTMEKIDWISQDLKETPGFLAAALDHPEEAKMGYDMRTGNQLVILPAGTADVGGYLGSEYVMAKDVFITTPDLLGPEDEMNLEHYGASGDESYVMLKNMEGDTRFYIKKVQPNGDLTFYEANGIRERYSRYTYEVIDACKDPSKLTVEDLRRADEEGLHKSRMSAKEFLKDIGKW